MRTTQEKLVFINYILKVLLDWRDDVENTVEEMYVDMLIRSVKMLKEAVTRKS